MPAALRLIDISDDNIITISQWQRAADPVREWPDVQLRVVTDGGRFSFNPSNLIGWKIVFVSGPVEVDADGTIYTDYASAIAAQSLLMENQDDERLNAAPFERGLGEDIGLSPRQQIAADHIEEHAWASALGREEDE